MATVQLTKLGHACLHITDGDASVLIDPGTFSWGVEAVPIRERTLAMPEVGYQRFERLRPADTELRVLVDGGSTDVS